MDYELIVLELKKASAFDLYRLRSVLDNLLEDPIRLNAIKRRLKPGMEITYFDPQENRLIAAVVEDVRRTRAGIREVQTGKRWIVGLCSINIEGADTDNTAKTNCVDRLSLKIHDHVSFIDNDGGELFGTVIKLNPKRAKIKTGQGTWSVPYASLSNVIDGEHAQDALLAVEYKVIPDQ